MIIDKTIAQLFVLEEIIRMLKQKTWFKWK